MVMKRLTVCVSAVLLSSMVYFTTASAGELAKEGSGKYRSGRTAEISTLRLGKEYLQINFDETGIVVDAPVDSPFYNASFNTMGTIQAIKGKFVYSGAALWTRPNGNEIYGIFRGEGKLGVGSTTSLDIVGGQGECIGITGTMELKSGPPAKSSKKGFAMGTTVGTVRWKIP
jgi:hypothetical protein